MKYCANPYSAIFSALHAAHPSSSSSSGKSLTINAVNILDYQDSTQDFTDPGNEAGKESCGDRDIVLLDADNGDAEISGHAWIALAL